MRRVVYFAIIVAAQNGIKLLCQNENTHAILSAVLRNVCCAALKCCEIPSLSVVLACRAYGQKHVDAISARHEASKMKPHMKKPAGSARRKKSRH